MKKVTKKKLKTIDKLIKEEMARQYRKMEESEVIEIIDEGIMSQLSAKAQGMATKIAAKGGNLGTAFQLAKAAAKGDQQAISNLSSQLKDANLEGQVKQAEALVGGFTKKFVAVEKEFLEDLTRAGLTALPGVAKVVDTLSKEADDMTERLSTQLMSMLRNDTNEIQKVAEKTGAAESDKVGGPGESTADSFSIPRNVAAGSKEEISLLQKRIADIEKKKNAKSKEKDQEGEGALSTMAGDAKQAASEIFGAE